VGVEEWEEIVGLFVSGSEIAEQAGWGGVQVHAAHGYLLAEYLSPLVSSLFIIALRKLISRADQSGSCSSSWCAWYCLSAFAPTVPHSFGDPSNNRAEVCQGIEDQ
jgi:hypothetical protein